MQRREFITLLTGAGIAWPVVVRAQQPAMPVIGFLNSASPGAYASRVRAFQQGLSETGYVEGQNVTIEYRWAEGQYDRLRALADDLVRRQVNVIVANSPAAVVAKVATTTIPIVFDSGTDPVKLGLVASLNRPGGNITGVSNLNLELGPKRMDLLRELVPTATSIALLVNPKNPGAETLSRDMQAAVSSLGRQLHVLRATTERDIDSSFATVVQLGAGALVIGSDPFFISRSEQLASLALRHSVPTVFQYREFTAVGGLVSYGGDTTEPYRLVGVYTGRILKGEKPANLPVQQSTKIELIINLKTAKALGLTVPQALLSRADEVIE